jgi:hypothetical protein
VHDAKRSGETLRVKNVGVISLRYMGDLSDKELNSSNGILLLDCY